jgi:uncharacterized membrane protein (DUF2068 family)
VRSRDAVRAIAVFEAAKGALVLAIGTGLLSMIHRDLEPLAAQLLSHLRLDPASRYPRIFADAAAAMTDGRLRLLAVGAAAYALLRFVEAYGLWQGKRWAVWFAAITAAIYIPFELYEVAHRVTALAIGALVLNIFVIALMCVRVRRTDLDAGRSGARRDQVCGPPVL